MIKKAQHFKTSCQSGFTLIELLIVLLILGILVAVAIPSFDNSKDKAQTAVTTKNQIESSRQGSTNQKLNDLSSQTEVPCTQGSDIPCTPVKQSDPTIYGTAVVGRTLTANYGSWGGNPTPSVAYQWQWSANGTSGWNDISNETKSVYVITSKMKNQFLRVQVTAINAAGAVTVQSSPTAAVTSAPTNDTTTTTPTTPVDPGGGGGGGGSTPADPAPDPTVVSSPVISGSNRVGSTLSSSTGTWSASPTPTYSYQWQTSKDGRGNWLDVDAATSSSFTLMHAQAGRYARVLVTATNSAGSGQKASSSTGVIFESISNTLTPVISGEFTPGGTISTTDGTWAGIPEPTLSYKWEVSSAGGDIGWGDAGGSPRTSPDYVIVPGDRDQWIRSKVTGTNEVPDSADSVSASRRIESAPEPDAGFLPIISGTVLVSNTITTTPGAWSGYPTPTYGYTWQVSEDNGLTWNTASGNGALTSSYTPTVADGGKILRVRVVASNSRGSGAPIYSLSTAAVAQPPSEPFVDPTISGSTFRPTTLTLNDGSATGTPTPTVQSRLWYRCSNLVSLASGSLDSSCSQIANATGTTYSPVDGDNSKYIVAGVTFANAYGTSSRRYSASTDLIKLPPVCPVPTITGSAIAGQQLSGSNNCTASPSPTLANSWQVSDNGTSGWSAASGVTTGASSSATSYTVAVADIGKYLRLHISASGVAGTASSDSLPSALVRQAPVAGNLSFTGPGLVKEYSAGLTGSAGAVASGADGNVWFVENAANKIGKITPSGTITEYSTGLSATAGLSAITRGDDGNMWFIEQTANKIGKITPSGIITEYSTGLSSSAGLSAIAPDSDGNLWFTEQTANKIGKITTSGTITEYSTGLSSSAGLRGITVSSDGNAWFVENTANKIGKITPDGTITEYSAGLSTSAGLRSIASGADGNIWFVEETANKIGKITTGGTITEYSTGLSAAAGLQAITPGADGNMWFSENSTNKIARITPSGVITEYAAGASPLALTSALDGSLWFATSSKINNFATAIGAVGATISAQSSAFVGSPTPTVSYQWKVNDSNISSGWTDASGTGNSGTGLTSDYVIPSALAGKYLKIVYTGLNSAGTASAEKVYGPVTEGPISQTVASTAAPAITGTPTTDSTLSASTGSWDGKPNPTFSYQWQVQSTAWISATGTGNTTSSYSPTAGDVGKALRVRVTANNGLTFAQKFSPATAAVSNPPVNTVRPTITGGVGSFNEYAITSASSNPFSLAPGPDGNMWMAEYGASKIAKITASGGITEYSPPTASSQPTSIVTGPDSNIWFTENATSKIGKMTSEGVFTEYATTTASAAPYTITSGPDGNLWFTENAANKIGKITTAGVITEYAIPTASSQPTGIASGSDGNVWFTEYNGNKIGKITPAGVITEYAIPTAGSVPYNIALGSDGNMWFTEISGNKIGKITPSGTITEYTVPTAASGPNSLALGADGNIWFSERAVNKIAKITTAGVITEYTVPTASSNTAPIASAPDGKIWFAEQATNKVGKMTTGAAIVGDTYAGTTGTWTGIPTPTLASQWQTASSSSDSDSWSSASGLGNNDGDQIVATGGVVSTIVDNGVTYKMHKFTTTGTDTFNVTSAPAGAKIDYLVVGGGGSTGRYGGGGGGGGLLSGTAAITTGSKSITVGAGGVGLVGGNDTGQRGTSGGNSVFSDTIALGGGAGGGYGNSNVGASSSAGLLGGSGGGGAPSVCSPCAMAGGLGTSLQGNDGGSTQGPYASYNGGGGGGAGQAGAAGTSTGKGGDGVVNSITGAPITYAGGGSGSQTSGILAGGSGGGGSGFAAGATGSTAVDGAANTGGGAGSPRDNSIAGTVRGGNGGSGVVIVRYRLASSLAYTFSPSDAGKYVRLKVTGTNIGRSVDATSVERPQVVWAPTNTARPTISGGVGIGKTLTASQGSWSGYPTPTFSYQWQSQDLASSTGIATTLGTTGSTPSGVATDAQGNVYTANYNSNTVSKITPGGTSTILGTTGSNPRGILVDSAGNIYTANGTSNNVSKITPGGTSTILGTTGGSPMALTTDSSGNIYTANFTSNNVSKITPGGTSTIFGVTGTSPYGITIDSSGNIYTANYSSNNVSKITPGGTSTILGATATQPVMITIDSAGNLYTANNGSNNVSKITPAGVSSILGTTGSQPYGITIDSSGNIYASNNGSNTVSKITPAGVSSIFATTGSTPAIITADSSNNIYTSNNGPNTVTKISPPWVSATGAGAGTSSYTIGAGDYNKKLRVSVLAKNNVSLMSATSDETAAVASPPVNTSIPTLITSGASASEFAVGADIISGSAAAVPSVVASGGTVSTVTDGDKTYRVHKFTTSGTFNVSSAETGAKLEYLVVAGGGGGGYLRGGGGGAGGLLSGTISSLATGAHTVTVGGGGVGGGSATNGGNSIFSGSSSLITSIGGGKGGVALGNAGAVGGSGGGNGGNCCSYYYAPVAGTAGQGNASGPSANGDNPRCSSGGGGAGGVGVGNCAAADGGPGKVSSITGSSIAYAGGGGGSVAIGCGEGYSTNPAGAGGLGGGGAGGLCNAAGTAGTDGLGGGGGTALAGGSGTVIVRYLVNTANKITTGGKTYEVAQFSNGLSSTFGTTGADPIDVVRDSSGNLYTANYSSNSVTKITPDGVSSTFASTGAGPQRIAIDPDGNLYTANYDSNNVTKITPAGVSSVYGTAGANPVGITIDASRNVYVVNNNGNNVTKITPAGVSSTFGYSASLSAPRGPVVDTNGNIYVASYWNSAVYKITQAGAISYFAATGPYPSGLVIDSSDNIYTVNQPRVGGTGSVTKITPAGTSTTLATVGSSPNGIAIDPDGNIYTANPSSNNVSKITPDGKSSIIATVGVGPAAIYYGADGNLYTANRTAQSVSKITTGKGNLTVKSAPASGAAFDYLLVGGGGGGGMDMAGGGGGGGYRDGSVSLSSGNYNVNVGGGGMGAPAGCSGVQPCDHQYSFGANNGQNSTLSADSLSSITALGGGFGGSSYYGYTPNYGYAGSGGSGGGPSGYSDGNQTRAGGAGTAGQGFNGGQGGPWQYYSGGGGGAGGNGDNAPSIAHGGPGKASSILGTQYYFGGGGGGAGYTICGGNGGIGGGGGGAVCSSSGGGSALNSGSVGGYPGVYTCGSCWGQAPGGNGGASTGGGGGGGSHYNRTNQGGNGGSGIVAVRTIAPMMKRIARGADGNMWFTESGNNKIGKITTAGTVTEYSTSQPTYGITKGPDGNIWFTSRLGEGGDIIGKVTPSGTITEYSTGLSIGSQPQSIVTGPDGNLWFTEPGVGKIGRITPSGTITEYSSGLSGNPSHIAAGNDNNLWFTEEGANKVGKITTSGTVTEYSSGITASAIPYGITPGPDGNMWFTEPGINKIAKITPAGAVTEYGSGLSAAALPAMIVAGPDGNMWFTERDGGKIGQITTSGVITETSAGLSAASGPEGIARGNDKIWFTEQQTGKVGSIAVSNPVVGGTISDTAGTWSGTPAPTYTHQWQNCSSATDLSTCANASGSGNSGSGVATTYTPGSGDVGKYLRAKVTGSNRGCSDDCPSAYSLLSPIVTQEATNTGDPTITGSKVTGNVLSASAGTWQGSPTPTYSYQWQVSDSGTGNWSSATGSGNATAAYTIAIADSGRYLRVQVTGSNNVGSNQAYSSATTVISRPPSNSTAPTIAASWTPDQLSNKALLWSRPESLDGLANGAAVSVWDDSSGHGGSFSQPDSLYQPAYTSSALNGFGAVTFSSGSKTRLTNPTTFDSPYSIMYVGRATTTSSSGRLVSSDKNNWLLGYWQTAENEMYGGDGFVSNPQTPQTTNWTIYGGQSNGSSGSLYKNGSLQATTANANGPDGLVLGGGGQGMGYNNGLYGEFKDGQVAEIIAYKNNLSASERQQLEGYLAWKYNLQGSLPADHPYKAAPPANGGKYVAQPGSWQGYPTPTYSYQWQTCDSAGTTCTDISGANTKAYSTTSTNNNAKLRARVTATNNVAPDAVVPSNQVTLPASIVAPQKITSPSIAVALSDSPQTWLKADTIDSPGGSGVGVIADGSLIAPTWTPEQLATGPSLWNRPESLTGTPGQTISSWPDSSGNARNFAQATAANQPTLVASGTGGRPSLLFDGVNDYMNSTSGTYGTPLTLFAIGSKTSSKTDHEFVLNGSYTDQKFLFMGTFNGNYGNFLGTGAAGGGNWTECCAANTPSAIINPGGSIMSMTTDGTTLTPYLNGTAQNTRAGGMGAFTGMQLGSQMSSASFWQGSVSEIIAIPEVLTTTERQKVEGYLAWKYNLQSSLAANHPYKSAAPTVSNQARSNENFTQGSSNRNYSEEVLADSPLAYWKLNETTGTSYTDSSSNNQTVTGPSAASLTAQGPSAELADRSVSLLANNLNKASTPLTATANWSMEAWVNPASLNQNGWVMYNGTDEPTAGTAGYGFRIGGSVAGHSVAPGGCLTGLAGRVAWITTNYCFPQANNWYHVVMTRDGSTIRFYVNGSEIPTTGGASSVPIAPSGSFNIGSERTDSTSTNFEYFNGKVADVALYPTRLPAGRVKEHYLSSKRPQLVTNGIGGLPTMRFDGINDYLDNNSGNYSKPMTVFSVAGKSSGSSITATGGTVSDITENGVTYRVHKFTTAGANTFNVTAAPAGTKIEYLAVGGGGSGGNGYNSANNGGGGGGGAVISGSSTITTGATAVTVGDGGAAGQMVTGGASSVLSTTASGGGYGGGRNTSNVNIAGGNGASGGGGGSSAPNGGGTGSQGSAGASGNTASPYQGGGGGGSAQAGNAAGTGYGGNGLSSSITGTSVYYGGGGGGGADASAGSGGLGGGASGITYLSSTPPADATANTGGGGGGGASRTYNAAGSKGGSGIVIIRYRLTGSGYERILHSNPSSDGNFFFGTSANNFATFTGGGLTNGIGLGGWNDVAANSPSQTVAASGSILAMSTDGTTLTPYVNGTAQTNKTGTMNSFTGMRLGGCSTSGCAGTQSYDGDVSEVLTFPTVLSVEDRQKVEGYLAWKYGLQTQLPSNHPYKTTQPTPTTAAVGQTLIGTEGKWNMGTSATNFYDQSWWRCSDATAASDYAPAGCNKTSNLANAYKVTSADDSKHLVYGTQATNSAGDNEAYSPSVAAGLVAPANSSLPTLTADSQTPTVAGGRGSWNYLPDSYTYQFQICSQALDPTSCANASGPGSTTLSYTPVALDMGKWLRLSVTATNAAGSSTSSSQTLKLDPPANTSAPSFSGSLIAGQTLNGNKGTWTGTLNATTSYQWQSSSDGNIWDNIPGATSLNYTTTDAVSEKYLRLKVTQVATTTVIAYSTTGANNASGSLVAPSAAPTVTVTPTNLVAAPAGADVAYESEVRGQGRPGPRTGAFNLTVNNGVTLGSLECAVDPADPIPSSVWQACSSSYTTGSLSANGGIYGDTHTIKVRGTNRSGTGSVSSFTWRIFPDTVAFSQGLSIPNQTYPNASAPGTWSVTGSGNYMAMCMSTPGNNSSFADPVASLTGYSVMCASGHQFPVGEVCSNTSALVGIYNITMGWQTSEKSAWTSVHRNCEPPGQSGSYPYASAGFNPYWQWDTQQSNNLTIITTHNLSPHYVNSETTTSNCLINLWVALRSTSQNSISPMSGLLTSYDNSWGGPWAGNAFSTAAGNCPSSIPVKGSNDLYAYYAMLFTDFNSIDFAYDSTVYQRFARVSYNSSNSMYYTTHRVR